MLNKKELEALRHIRNYLTYHSKMPSVRKLQALLGYQSPRSSSVILESLTEKDVLVRDKNGNLTLNQNEAMFGDTERAVTIDVPLLGVVACGTPIFAEENVEAQIPVSDKLINSSSKYFILRAHGDSMNESGIEDGDLVLVKQQQTANSGENVVALIDDEATIKEFVRGVDTVVLKPHSTNNVHQPIILTTDFRIQGIVVSVIKM